MKQTQRYTVDGVAYGSLDEMPTEVRAKWDATVALIDRVFADVAESQDPSIRRTTIKFEQTIVQGDADAVIEVRELDKTVSRRQKRLAVLFSVGLFAFCALDLVRLFSRVRLTVHYGPAWFVAYAAMLFALLFYAWRIRDKMRAHFNRVNGARGNGVTGSVLVGLLAFVGFSAFGVFGGVPVLAHYLTAHPGELIVTVAGKESGHIRYTCTPRFKIEEFTFFSKNYMCPSDQAFKELDVGSTVRLQGDISPFGISIERYYWKSEVTKQLQ
jgi:hypothetical protein